MQRQHLKAMVTRRSGEWKGPDRTPERRKAAAVPEDPTTCRQQVCQCPHGDIRHASGVLVGSLIVAQPHSFRRAHPGEKMKSGAKSGAKFGVKSGHGSTPFFSQGPTLRKDEAWCEVWCKVWCEVWCEVWSWLNPILFAGPNLAKR